MRNLTSLITVLALSFSTASLVGCATSGDDVTAADDADATGVGKFDMWQASDAQWHFHLKSGNGRILLTSEAYASRTGAINGILSVLDNGVDAHQFVVVPAASGYLLHLNAGNNEIVSFSQSYSTKSNATRAITSCVNAVTTYLDKQAANTTGARIQVDQGATNQFNFNVYAGNGQVVLSSESYTTAAAAFNGAYAVQDAAADSANFAVKMAADGRYYFTLTAQNGQVVGTSQMYTSKESATSGIASVQGVVRGLTIL